MSNQNKKQSKENKSTKINIKERLDEMLNRETVKVHPNQISLKL